MGFLTRCKRLFLFAFLLQFCNMLFSFFLKTFLILFEKQQLFTEKYDNVEVLIAREDAAMGACRIAQARLKAAE